VFQNFVPCAGEIFFGAQVERQVLVGFVPAQGKQFAGHGRLIAQHDVGGLAEFGQFHHHGWAAFAGFLACAANLDQFALDTVIMALDRFSALSLL
jgi:hypothetical protein